MLLVFLCGLCALLGCAHEPRQLVSPQSPAPHKRFVVIRDYNTTWHALLRAISKMQGQQIKSSHKKTGTLVLQPVTAMIEPYCDCGRLGKRALTGKVRRETVVKAQANAPQETIVEISSVYVTAYNWKDSYGEAVRKETIECISNGQFEQELYRGLIRHLSP